MITNFYTDRTKTVGIEAYRALQPSWTKEGSFEKDNTSVADMLAHDVIMGWAHGRYEIGSRALGNWSIPAAAARFDSMGVIVALNSATKDAFIDERTIQPKIDGLYWQAGRFDAMIAPAVGCRDAIGFH